MQNYKQSIETYNTKKNLNNLFKINEHKIDFLKISHIPKTANKEKSYKYGKYDNKGIPILPNPDKLVKKKNLIIFDFVEEMIDELKNYMKFSNLRGITEGSNDNFINFEPRNTTYIFQQLYEQYMNIISQSIFQNIENEFNKNINTNIYTSDVKSIDDFIHFIKKHFLDENNIKNLPFTEIGYFESNIISPLFTGIVIEIDNPEKYNDENYKFTHYYGNRDFLFFSQACEKIGFKIDEQIPWRLYVNLNSPNTFKYLNKKNIKTLDKFFEIYYNPLKQNIHNMFMLINNMYKQFIKLYPLYSLNKYKNNNICKIVKERNNKLYNINNVYDFDKLICLYIEIRLKELLKYNVHIYEHKLKNIRKMKKILDKDKFSKYITHCLV